MYNSFVYCIYRDNNSTMSSSEATAESKNWGKVASISLDVIPKHLRQLFKDEWDALYPSTPWDDIDNAPPHLLFKTNEQAGINPRQVASLQGLSADRNSWDATALYQVLLFSVSLDLKNRNLALWDQINVLKGVRNGTVHDGGTTMSRANFEQEFNKVESVYGPAALNIPSVLKQVEDIRTNENRPTPAEIKDMKRRLKSEQDNRMLLVFLCGAMVMIIAYIAFHKLNNATKHSETHLTNSNRAFLAVISAVVITIIACNIFNVNLVSDIQNGPYIFSEAKCLSYFRGRNSTITDTVAYLTDKTRLVNIHGAYGMGKTTLAMAIGRQLLEEQYGFKVAFVNLKQRTTSPEIAEQILISLRIPVVDKFQLAVFEAKLRQGIRQKTVLILDNIEDVLKSNNKAKFKDFISRHIFNNHLLTVMTTSRIVLCIDNVPMTNVELKGLHSDDCVEILEHFSPGTPKNEAEELANLARGNPLLVEVFGTYLKYGYSDADELILKIHESDIKILKNSKMSDADVVEMKNLLEKRHTIS